MKDSARALDDSYVFSLYAVDGVGELFKAPFYQEGSVTAGKAVEIMLVAHLGYDKRTHPTRRRKLVIRKVEALEPLRTVTARLTAGQVEELKRVASEQGLTVRQAAMRACFDEETPPPPTHIGTSPSDLMESKATLVLRVNHASCFVFKDTITHASGKVDLAFAETLIRLHVRK